ncbi:transmembrane protein 69-like isoform X2 [Artemia franciscana]|nr:hypothetical protein QYM36_006939 [Artemia franciscana]
MPCVAGMFKAVTPIKTVATPLRKVYAHVISTSACHKRWSERSPNQPNIKKEESEKPGGRRPIMDIKALKEAPKPALWLGVGGLVPFVVPPVVMLLTGYYVPQVHESQVIYGATILSFLGGARWGVAVVKDSGLTPTWASLGFSVTPPLLAWLSLTLLPSIDVKTSMIILGLSLSLFNDIFTPGYAPWFKSLRVILTFVATFSLALANIAYEAVKEGRMLESDLKINQI